MDPPHDEKNIGKYVFVDRPVLPLVGQTRCIYNKQNETITLNDYGTSDTMWVEKLAVVVYTNKCGAYAVLNDGSKVAFYGVNHRDSDEAFATFHHLVAIQGLEAVVVPVEKGILMIMKKSANCVVLNTESRGNTYLCFYFSARMGMALEFPNQKEAADWRDAFFKKSQNKV